MSIKRKWTNGKRPWARVQPLPLLRSPNSTATSLNFESSKIEVLKNIQGDTDENTMLWIPGQRILIAGDVLFNDMHLYTAETDSKAREKWLKSLNRIRELNASVVIPGHSKVGAPLDASTAIDFTDNYLSVFEEELKKAKDPDSLVNAMKERFPSADFLLHSNGARRLMLNPEQKRRFRRPSSGRVRHRGMDVNEKVQDCSSGRLPKCCA